MLDPSVLFQLLLGGLLLGGIYSLTALGLSLIFGVSRVLNLAHGDFLMLGGLSAFLLFSAFELNPFVSLLVIVPTFILVGAVFERVFIRPIADRPFHDRLIASVLVTLGMSLFISDVAAYFWGTFVKGVSVSMPSFEIAGVFIPTLRLLTLAVIVVLTVVLHQFLSRSALGRAVRAIAQNRQGALLVGIDASRISMITFGIGTALAAGAGVFYLLLFTISPYIGLPIVLKALTVIVLGGLGSLMGALWGGLILGVAETMTGFWIGEKWSPTVSVLLLLGVLLVRPSGLFGRA
jgi:branched-chain amino acid transport system permease protein